MRPALTALMLPLLVACTQTDPVTEGRIETREQFLATAADRTVRNDLATVTITRDGRITGVSDGQPIAGTWEFRDGFWCRTIIAPVTVPEDCQVWEIRDGVLIITRDRGTGSELRFALPQRDPAEG